jgi:hypothetical protein
VPKLLLAVTILAGVAALALIAVRESGQRGTASKAFAVVTPPTSTPGATPTPKPNGLGPLTGLVDVAAGNPVSWRCIVSLHEDSVTLSLEGHAQCYSQTDAGFFGAEPPCAVAAPPRGICADNGGPNPPPPPPYTGQPPMNLVGSYNPLSGTVSLSGCLADIGSTAGPNVIVKFSTSTVDIWFGQTNANCSALTPDPPLSPTLPNISYSATPVSLTRDFDGDGCSDEQELWAGKPGGATICGDDPWNPLDSPGINGTPAPIGSADDIAGVYDVQVRLARQDITGSGTPVPGHYITCAAYVQKGLQDVGNSTGMHVEARLLCNHDSPTELVNPNYGVGCGTNNHLCADGSPGAPPPGCKVALPITLLTLTNCEAASPDTAHGGMCNFARGYPPYNEPPCFDLTDLSSVKWLFPPVGKPADTYPVPAAKQPALTGAISGNTLTLAGCFKDWDNTAVDGNSYWSLKANVHTGVGLVNIWRNLTAGEQTAGQCGTATPPGTAPGRAADYGTMPIQLTRQTADTCTNNNAVCNPVGIKGSIGNIVDVGGLVTVTAGSVNAPVPHKLNTGDMVTITGTTNYNGNYTITVANLTQFTFSLAGSPFKEAAGTYAQQNLSCSAGSTAPCGYNTANYDSDGDGCPDAWELSDVTNVPYRKAGLRDPSNRWDYPDVNHDGLVDIGDISDVVQKYFIDKGETTGGAGGPDALPGGYLIDTDRTGLAGAEDWELNSPDGYVTIDDVVDSVNSYAHHCPPLDSNGNPIPLPAPNAG